MQLMSKKFNGYDAYIYVWSCSLHAFDYLEII